MQRNLATKIQAKWESGLTAVWLKQDPPVNMVTKCIVPICITAELKAYWLSCY